MPQNTGMCVSSGKRDILWKLEGQTQKQQRAGESKESIEERNGADEKHQVGYTILLKTHGERKREACLM